MSPVARASVQRVWTGARFAVVRASVESRRATDAAPTLAAGLRRTTAAVEAYAEPAPSVTVGASATGLAYGDGNRRVQAAASARWLPLRLGTTGDRPGLALGPAVSAVYDDAATIYPSSVPYFTPDNLWTGSLGLAGAVALTRRVRFDGSVGLARQTGTFAATSIEYGAAVDVEAGPGTVRLEARRTGSSAYSSDLVGVSVRVRLP